jgi:leader peptidase (prepilin peptidase)/N-methyltransferase
LAVLEAIVFRLPSGTALHRAGVIYLADFGLALALVAAAFIDFEHMVLPDTMTFGGTLLGIATASLRDQRLVTSLIGAIVGFVAVWLPFIVVYPKLRGTVGMGLGDAKLLMLAGAWFGWGGALCVLGFAAVQGTVATLVTLLVRGRIEEPSLVRAEREALKQQLDAMSPESRDEALHELALDPLTKEPGPGVAQARIPFGPFLSLTIIEGLLFGRDILRWAYP